MAAGMFTTRYEKLPGTAYDELVHAARQEYHAIQRRTPRRKAYVRSRYFSQDKVFLDEFWIHLAQKNLGDKGRRVSLFLCAIDLIRHSNVPPEIIVKRQVRLYRFAGQTRKGQIFSVQIKEHIKSGRKDFLSVFPV